MRRRPRREDYLDHEDQRRQHKTRDQQRASLFKCRQGWRNKALRWSITVEVPSWINQVGNSEKRPL